MYEGKKNLPSVVDLHEQHTLAVPRNPRQNAPMIFQQLYLVDLKYKLNFFPIIIAVGINMQESSRVSST